MLTSLRPERVTSFWRACARERRLAPSLEQVWAAPWRTSAVRVQTVNLQHVHLIATCDDAAEAATAAHLITADGWPLAALARVTGIRCHRVTGRDLVADLLQDPSCRGLRVALLGSRPDVGAAFADLLARNGVVLAHRRHGDATRWDTDEVAAELLRADCDIVLVALGAPKGEPLGQALAERLPRGLIVGIGGAIEMATHHMPGAPGWVGRVGLEWAYRLAHEPRRLGRRYLVESPLALAVLALTLVVRRP